MVYKQRVLRTSALLVLTVIIFLITGLSAHSEEPPAFLLNWGSEGAGDGEFESPFDVAVDSMENVYVVDYENHRIQKFSSEGTFITKWGSVGSGDGQFNSPYGITIDSSDNIYVSDTSNDNIQKFTADGAFITKWDIDGSPWGLAVDSSDNVYVVDSSITNRILVFTSDGVFINTWGSKGSEEEQFKFAEDIALDSSGNAYVVDSGRDSVLKFNPDGVFITKWFGDGLSEDGLFYAPEGIAVDCFDNVYVGDSGWDRVQKFTADGVYLTKWGVNGDGDGEMCWTIGVTTDNQGNIYVAEGCNHRISKFGYPNTPAGTEIEVNDVPSGITITFTEVTVRGNTTVTATETAPDPPGGYNLLSTYYEISTSADYTEPITVCIPYDDSALSQEEEAGLGLWHDEDSIGAWENITTAVDTTENVVCGQTDNLSPFGVFSKEVIPAVIDIHPNKINLKSKGNFITGYIALPSAYDVNNINIHSVLLGVGQDRVQAEAQPIEIGDYDSDGVDDLMVKFDRSAVHAIVTGGSVEISVSGSLINGTAFLGTDIVTVLDQGKEHTDESDHSSIEY